MPQANVSAAMATMISTLYKNYNLELTLLKIMK